MRLIILFITILQGLYGSPKPAEPDYDEELLQLTNMSQASIIAIPVDQKLHSYQTDSQSDSVLEAEYKENRVRNPVFCCCLDKFESYELYKSINSAIYLGLVLILMQNVRGICSAGFKKDLYSLLIGFPATASLTMELTLPLAMITCYMKTLNARFPRLNMYFEGANFALALAKTLGTFIPVGDSRSAVTEVCSWTGQTLFESPRWVIFGLIISILLVLIPLVQSGIHRYHD